MSDKQTKEWKQEIYRRIRDEYGAVTPAELHHALIERGFKLSRQTPYDWAKGKSKPPANLLTAISKDRNKPVDYFLIGRKSESKEAHSVATDLDVEKAVAENGEDTGTGIIFEFVAMQVKALRGIVGREQLRDFLIAELQKLRPSKRRGSKENKEKRSGIA